MKNLILKYEKNTLFIFIFSFVSFASFPIKNDTIKKETVEQYYKRINKQMEVNDNKWEIEEVKPFIDVERVPKLLWLSLLIPIINSIAFFTSCLNTEIILQKH